MDPLEKRRDNLIKVLNDNIDLTKCIIKNVDDDRFDIAEQLITVYLEIYFKLIKLDFNLFMNKLKEMGSEK